MGSRRNGGVTVDTVMVFFYILNILFWFIFYNEKRGCEAS